LPGNGVDAEAGAGRLNAVTLTPSAWDPSADEADTEAVLLTAPAVEVFSNEEAEEAFAQKSSR
jgi:hypothetical protein